MPDEQPDRDPAPRNARILAAVARTDPSASTLERLVHAAMELLELSGAAVALISDQGEGTILASAGAGATELADRQFELGVGPSLSAHAHGELVMTSDLAEVSDERWPPLAPLVGTTRAVLAAPLRIGAITLGVLVVHRDRPGRWSGRERLDALAVADLSTAAALDQTAGFDGQPLAAVPHNAVVHQATGMLAARFDIGLGAALARLRAVAFSESRRLDEVATDIVTNGRKIDE